MTSHNTDKLYRFAYTFIKWLMLGFSALLFISGFFYTYYADNMETQQALGKWDLSLPTLLLTSLAAVLLYGIITLTGRSNLSPRILFAGVCLWILGWGAVLVVFSKTVPAADALSVYSAAGQLAIGDTSVIHPTDSYLSYYPQQVGLMAFLEVLIRLWNLLPFSVPAYHFIKCLYTVLVCVAVYYQYKSVELQWLNRHITCLYLLLAGANLPLIMYSSFVYGEIPSFAAFSAGYFFLLLLLDRVHSRKRQLSYIFLCVLCFTLSVMLRKNTLVLMIAVIAVLLTEAWKRRRLAPLALALLLTVSSLNILPAVETYYEHRADSTLSTGVPAMSYFAMGMQPASRGNGWYNGFNFYTYQDTGMDTGLTNELSAQAIRVRLDEFKEDPSSCFQFYLHKFLSQWTDGTYASRQATLATYGGRHPVFQSLYEGSLSKGYIDYCNILQTMLYLGVLLFCLQQKTGNTPPALLNHIGLIGAFGGFLFHMIWEANSRYIFVYGLLLMPYAAYGLQSLWAYLQKRKSNNTCDRQTNA